MTSLAPSLASTIPWRLFRRFVVAAGALFVIAGVSAPWIDGSRWTGAITRHLEQNLGRKVSFESVHFTLFTGLGFSLENVTISEDPRFGREPFAFVPVLQVRLRPDRLLLGEFRVSTLRLNEPSLNLVKRSDESWNVLELLRRLSAPRRSPLHIVPIFEMSDARVYLKFGARKTTLYLLDAGLTVYPERSGKLNLRFSGAPARTDRAGNGFGHLRGSASIRLDDLSARDGLDANLDLDPSNLSELTTLVGGHDLGIHGTVTSRLHLSGPLRDLQVAGNMRCTDVHRWDLIPSNGGDLFFRFGGTADLVRNRLALKTWGREASPLSVALDVNDLLTRPDWTLTARMRTLPLRDVLPLSRRLGLDLPPELTIAGSADGEFTLAASGFSGSGTLRDISATLPGTPSLSTSAVNLFVQQDRLHFEPAIIEIAGARLQMGGDYFLTTSKTTAAIEAFNTPVSDLKASVAPWLGLPQSLDLLRDGTISGRILYSRGDEHAGSWGGKLEFSAATLPLEGLAKPLRSAEGRLSFNGDELEVARFTGIAGQRVIHGSYRRVPSPRHAERLRLEVPVADLVEIQTFLAPTLEAQGWLARLHVAKRTVPPWLAARDMEGDLSVVRLLVDGADVGSMSSHFIWRGTSVEFTEVALHLPEGIVHAHGSAALASYQPRYQFNARVTSFPWSGGTVSADGTFETSGAGSDAFRNLQSNGSFSADNVTVSPADFFDRVSGTFLFSFAEGWPDLRLQKLQAENADGAWSGEAASQSDGKLLIDLERAGQQRHIVSTLAPAFPVASSLLPAVAADANGTQSRLR